MATLFPLCAMRPSRPALPFSVVPRVEKVSDCVAGGWISLELWRRG
jgi:hypothetical protein